MSYNSPVMRLWLQNKKITNEKQPQAGFTIVELLLVIVVIAILAAIVIATYNSVIGKSHDSAIKTDLSNIAKKIKLYEADNGVYPTGSAQLTTLDIKVSKDSYGSHYVSGGNNYNLVYCRMPAAAPTKFALVGFSKSGKGFMYSANGTLTEYTGAKTGSGAICTTAGVSMAGNAPERDWFYDINNWQSFVGS